MTDYRIAWHVVDKEGHTIFGRSLIQAKTPEEAVHQLISTKISEYSLTGGTFYVDGFY